MDYRGLNQVTIKNWTPLPRISETLHRLRRSKRFTKFDLKDAYHRLRIRKGDEWKPAFRTRYGHFEYCVMPYAPATFQTYVNQALVGLVDVTCVVYLDDILISSEDVDQHEDAVREGLGRPKQASLLANPQKREPSTDHAEFPGSAITPEGAATEPSRVTIISHGRLSRLFERYKYS